MPPGVLELDVHRPDGGRRVLADHVSTGHDVTVAAEHPAARGQLIQLPPDANLPGSPLEADRLSHRSSVFPGIRLGR
jgi:hypothetical protein